MHAAVLLEQFSVANGKLSQDLGESKTLECIVYLFLKSTDVCYLRLDFETFNLAGPASTEEVDNGHGCTPDAFAATVNKSVIVTNG